MPTVLETRANERSTYPVVITFRDEDGELVTPTAATWTLTDGNGTVINEREEVTIASLSSSVTIVLSGDDLALTANGGELRLLTIEATYTSTLGSGLPLRDEIQFRMQPLVAIT